MVKRQCVACFVNDKKGCQVVSVVEKNERKERVMQMKRKKQNPGRLVEMPIIVAAIRLRKNPTFAARIHGRRATRVSEACPVLIVMTDSYP